MFCFDICFYHLLILGEPAKAGQALKRKLVDVSLSMTEKKAKQSEDVDSK